MMSCVERKTKLLPNLYRVYLPRRPKYLPGNLHRSLVSVLRMHCPALLTRQ
jgi:hypothetical protein